MYKVKLQSRSPTGKMGVSKLEWDSGGGLGFLGLGKPISSTVECWVSDNGSQEFSVEPEDLAVGV